MARRDDPRLSDLFRRAGIETLNGAALGDLCVRAITDDSRAVEPGSCFVAVRGESVDGHRFIDDAVAGGATAVVFERAPVLPPGVAGVQVADSRRTLAKLSACFYRLDAAAARGFPLVGVTGTNGKTTVAWLVRHIMRPAALIGTIEYDLIARRVKAPLTTPGALALARLLAEAREAGGRCGVLEVSSHALQQRRCDGLSFAAAVFTNLSGDHLDYHGSMEEYFAAKRRLFDLLDPNGVAVLNVDDARGARLAQDCASRVVRYGLARRADVWGAVEAMDRAGTTLAVCADGVGRRVRLSLVGRHNASNALAAFAVARSLGVESDLILHRLETVTGVPGRLERVEVAGQSFSVFVDYAHTDDALRNALGAVRPLTQGRLICVFGCGGDRDRTKRPRMAAAVADGADVAVVTSDNPRSEDPARIIDDVVRGFLAGHPVAVHVEPDRRRAIALAVGMARDGDAILIAGKGHEDYQIVGERVLSFDDAQVAREILGGVVTMEEVA